MEKVKTKSDGEEELMTTADEGDGEEARELIR